MERSVKVFKWASRKFWVTPNGSLMFPLLQVLQKVYQPQCESAAKRTYTEEIDLDELYEIEQKRKSEFKIQVGQQVRVDLVPQCFKQVTLVSLLQQPVTAISGKKFHGKDLVGVRPKGSGPK